MPPALRVKVCCIRDREEAALAVAAGADALGLVSEMPSGPGVIDEATIAEVASAAPPACSSMLPPMRGEWVAPAARIISSG